MIPIQPPDSTNPLSNQPLSSQSVSPIAVLSEGARALLDAAVLPARLPNLIIGEQVTARIAQQINDRQIEVLIKNALFTLTLPPGLQLKGDTLNLRVANLKPGLTFALTDSEQSGDGKESSVQVDLSPASRYLTRLLSAAQQDDAGAQQQGSAGTKTTPDQAQAAAGSRAQNLASALADELATPPPTGKESLAVNVSAGKLFNMTEAQTGKPLLLDTQNQAPAQLASDLKQGVGSSGLFYESHLKAWDLGKLPLEALRAEPQAKSGQLLLDPGSASQKALPELGHLVQRQLNTLETSQIPLQGLAWPGQPMQMLIQQEATDERQASGESEQQAWTTHLSLNLPSLGGMAARVRLIGKSVQVSFVTAQTEAGGLIQGNRAKLEAGLAAAGLDLVTLSVKNEETPSE